MHGQLLPLPPLDGHLGVPVEVEERDDEDLIENEHTSYKNDIPGELKP